MAINICEEGCVAISFVGDGHCPTQRLCGRGPSADPRSLIGQLKRDRLRDVIKERGRGAALNTNKPSRFHSPWPSPLICTTCHEPPPSFCLFLFCLPLALLARFTTSPTTTLYSGLSSHSNLLPLFSKKEQWLLVVGVQRQTSPSGEDSPISLCTSQDLPRTTVARATRMGVLLHKLTRRTQSLPSMEVVSHPRRG